MAILKLSSVKRSAGRESGATSTIDVRIRIRRCDLAAVAEWSVFHARKISHIRRESKLIVVNAMIRVACAAHCATVDFEWRVFVYAEPPGRTLLVVAHPNDDYYFAATVYRMAMQLQWTSG